MPGGSSATQDVPLNEAEDYDSLAFTSANNNQRVVDLSDETQVVIIVAHPNNSGIIFIGFDDNVTVTNGLPLESGGSTVLPVDASTLGVFAVADTAADELRYAALG